MKTLSNHITTTQTEFDLKPLITELLSVGHRRQVWMFFFEADGTPIKTIIPMDGLPASPSQLEATSDLGTQTFSYVLSDRIRSIVEMLGAASCALVWERPGEGEPNSSDLDWAKAFARQLQRNRVVLRSQYLLHERGVSEIAL